MLPLMNCWNAVWRSNLAEIEGAFRSHSEAEDQAFERQLRRRTGPRWKTQRQILRYTRPKPAAKV